MPLSAKTAAVAVTNAAAPRIIVRIMSPLWVLHRVDGFSLPPPDPGIDGFPVARRPPGRENPV
ncbi:hypothetical protein GCM10020254_10710 [Streptomyces goshikiensis]